MSQTIDEFFSSPQQVSARRTKRILETLKKAAPEYNNITPAVENLSDEHRKALQTWAETRDLRSVVNVRPGVADKIINSGKFYTPHDKVSGAAHTGGLVSEERLRQMRSSIETNLGLPHYDSSIQDDPIKGLRPVSGENLPKSFFDVQPNLMRQIHGSDVPIMHPYPYGGSLMQKEVGFAKFARPSTGYAGGRYDRLILRPETAGRSSITAGDFLADKNPAIPLSDISNPEKSVALFGTSSTESITASAKMGAEDVMSFGFNERNFRSYETLTLGVGMEDIQAIISHPEHIDVSSMPENLQKLSRMNTVHGDAYDFGKMLHQSQQRIKASEYGIDYVHGVFDDVEFHNPNMTKSFMSSKGSSWMFEGTDINPSAGETPFEAYVKSIRQNLQAGKEAIGLGGIADEDRPFVIGLIDEHLQAYNKHKSFKYGSTMDAVERLNFGKISDVNTQAVPMARSIAQTERIQKNISANVALGIKPETIEEGVAVTVKRSAATRGLLEAATEASSHVASGKSGSKMLRTAGAALSILRKRF
jgi:hypothetical protein